MVGCVAAGWGWEAAMGCSLGASLDLSLDLSVALAFSWADAPATRVKQNKIEAIKFLM